MDTGYGRSKDRTQNSVLANEFLTHVGHRLQLWLDSLAVSVALLLAFPAVEKFSRASSAGGRRHWQ